MLALLDRSIEFGHARLAVLRLAGAAHLGADLADAHWRYCEDVVTRSNDPQLAGLFRAAADATRH